MSRGIGEFGPIQELIPEWGAIIVALITQLGDVWFLGLLVGLVYWFHRKNREDAAVIIGFTIAGLALISGLKHIFGLPRPDQPLVEIEALPWMVQPLYEATGIASGYGFPSGHALMTTIVYVGLANRLSVSTPRRRFLSAGFIITAVCLSRVALGVHFLVDVIAGVGMGLVFLLVAEWLLARYSADQATVAFALAVLISAFNLGVGGMDTDGLLLIGASLGTFGGWQLVILGRDLFDASRPSTALRPILIRGILAGAALIPLFVALEEFSLLSLPGRGGALGLAFGVFITLPVLRHSKRSTRCWVAVSFWGRMAMSGGRYLLRLSTWRRAIDMVLAYGRKIRFRIRRN